MAATGLVTSAVSSATQGAYDNAYIPAVYFGALLAAACTVELAALAAKLAPSNGWAVWSMRERPSRRLGSLRLVSVLGLGLLASHAMIRWMDPSPYVPSREDRAAAGRLLAYLAVQGPEIFVPCHPFYSVQAGGRGHLHAMGLNDVYAWPHADPEGSAAMREHLRASVMSSLKSRRWKVIVDDDCFTPRLFGLNAYYHRVEDLALSGRSPRSITGYPCAPRYVWLPRPDGS
jgi:hypothetical protein